MQEVPSDPGRCESKLGSGAGSEAGTGELILGKKNDRAMPSGANFPAIFMRDSIAG